MSRRGYFFPWAAAFLSFLCACAGAHIDGPAAQMIAPGVISTPMNEFGAARTPDGSELYFSISAERSYMYAIAVSRHERGRWTAPQIAPFSFAGKNFDPSISPDGLRLYFISDRGVHGGLSERPAPRLWMTERASRTGPWGAPRRLDVFEGSPRVWFATEASDGTLFVAAAIEDLPGVDIFRIARNNGVFAEAEPIGAPIETAGLEGEPVIAPDQSFILFAAYERQEGYGNWDIYISFRQGAEWAEPINLGPRVNTRARDYSPRLAPDGYTLIFTSERHFRTGHEQEPLTMAALNEGLAGPLNGSGNIFSVDLRSLGLLPDGRGRRRAQ